MKALQQRAPFAGINNPNHSRGLEEHRKRVKSAKKCIDNEPNEFYLNTKKANSNFNAKRKIARLAAEENIRRGNFMLAERIFKIMQGESELAAVINKSEHIENHPGTMNFRRRLKEAEDIHQKNLTFALRMQTIEPIYKNSDLKPESVLRSPRTPRTATAASSRRRRSPKKNKFMKEFEYSLQRAAAERSNRGESAPVVSGGFAFSGGMSPPAEEMQSLSARGHYSGGDLDYLPNRPRTVLLQYTKAQNGRMLDVVVLKEPFRDSYAIFGRDVDDGQRFELRLTSEDVSTILDGDILVTSVDNVEVWMALLNKVRLNPVMQFTQAPLSSDEVDVASQERQLFDQIKHDYQQRKPQPPELSQRPSNSRPSNRFPSAPESTQRPSVARPVGRTSNATARERNANNATFDTRDDKNKIKTTSKTKEAKIMSVDEILAAFHGESSNLEEPQVDQESNFAHENEREGEEEEQAEQGEEEQPQYDDILLASAPEIKMEASEVLKEELKEVIIGEDDVNDESEVGMLNGFDSSGLRGEREHAREHGRAHGRESESQAVEEGEIPYDVIEGDVVQIEPTDMFDNEFIGEDGSYDPERSNYGEDEFIGESMDGVEEQPSIAQEKLTESIVEEQQQGQVDHEYEAQQEKREQQQQEQQREQPEQEPASPKPAQATAPAASSKGEDMKRTLPGAKSNANRQTVAASKQPQKPSAPAAASQSYNRRTYANATSSKDSSTATDNNSLQGKSKASSVSSSSKQQPQKPVADKPAATSPNRAKSMVAAAATNPRKSVVSEAKSVSTATAKSDKVPSAKSSAPAVSDAHNSKEEQQSPATGSGPKEENKAESKDEEKVEGFNTLLRKGSLLEAVEVVVSQAMNNAMTQIDSVSLASGKSPVKASVVEDEGMDEVDDMYDQLREAE